MAGELVTWSDYEGLAAMNGIGSGDNGALGGLASQEDVDALNKALAAGSAIDNPGASAGEGFPLRVESLDKNLFNVLYTAKDVRFYKALYKQPAYNTVEEHNRLESYGSGDAAFIAEGDLPSEDDSTYSRNYTKIKFMGTTRRVTHVMSLLKAAHGPAVAREVTNGTMWLLRQVERALFEGDEDMVSIQFDGLEKLLVSAWGSTRLEDGQLSGWEDDVNIIDMRGAPMSEDALTDGVERVIAEPNYGAPSDLWVPPRLLKDFSKILYPKERYDLPAPTNGKAGIAIKAVATPFGDVALQNDIFIPDSSKPAANGVGKAAVRPGAPTIGTPTSPVYAGSNTTYFAAADAGTYIYKIVAGSRYGRSAPATSASIAVSAGDQVSLPVTDAGPDTSYYDVYRSDLNGTADTCRKIMRVARSGASQTIVDLNRFLPNTSKGYLLTHQADVLKILQLAPFTKINLATIDTSIRWMQVLYQALQVQKPLQNLIFVNVGRLETGAEAL